MKGIFRNSRGLLDLDKYGNLDFMAVMETSKHDMSKTNLTRLFGGADFAWYCFTPRGRSGGILLGFRNEVLDLSLIVEGEFYIKFHLCNKIDNFKWILMAVYGSDQDEFKSAFFTELVWACQQNSLPTLLKREEQ